MFGFSKTFLPIHFNQTELFHFELLGTKKSVFDKNQSIYVLKRAIISHLILFKPRIMPKLPN